MNASFSSALSRALGIVFFFVAFHSAAHAQTHLPAPPSICCLAPTSEEAWPNGPTEEPATLQFGAAIAIDRNTVLVGMPAYGPTEGIGRVAVFTRRLSGSWVRTGTHDPPDAATHSTVFHFGARVALEHTVALIGTQTELYVFRRAQGTWNFEQMLTIPAGERLDGGVAVDGGSLLVGGSSADGRGLVHVFERAPGTWRSVETLRAAGGSDGDGFGASLAAKHGTLVVGTPGYQDGQGAAFVYQHFGHFWAPYKKLLASDRGPGDSFGASVATNGYLIAVGAPQAHSRQNDCAPFGVAAGAAYVFVRHHARWLQRPPVLDPRSDCVFGFAAQIGIHNDYLVTSSPAIFPGQESTAWVYRFAGPAYEPTYLVESPIDGSDTVVALSGNDLILGYPYDRFFSVGAASVFVLDASQ